MSDQQVPKDKAGTIVRVTFDALRVIPEQTKPVKNLKTDRLTDLLAILFIFGISMWIRFWARDIFIDAYGDQAFNIRINPEDTLGIGGYLGVDIGTEIISEGYNDYNFYYLDYIKAFVDKNWNPYEGNLVEGDILNAYVYGPFYIYFISLGNAFFDLSPRDSVIYSNLIFDSATYVMVYILAKRVTGNVIAMAIAILGSLSPIAIFYADIRLLNAPQMNFFALLFVYFYLDHRDHLATITLAIATLNKQFPLFLAMPLGMFLARRYGLFKAITFTLLFLMWNIILSLPWVILTPRAYFTQLFLPGGGKEEILCPTGGVATNLVNGELNTELCAQDPAMTSRVPASPEFAEISEFGKLLDVLVNSHILFFASLFLLAWVGFTAYDHMEKDPKLYYRFYAAYFGLSHATIARGIYKYYLTLLIPFFILAFIPGDRDKSFHIRLGAMLKDGWSKWIDPKNRIGPATKEYWLYFLVLTISTFGIFWLITLAVSLFTDGSNYNNFWVLIFTVMAIIFIIKPGEDQTIGTANKTIKVSKSKQRGPFIIIMGFSAAYALMQIGNIYFENDEDSLYKHQIILLILFASFISLPYLQNMVTKENSLNNYVTLSYSQLIMDIIGFLLAFIFINFFHIELFLLHRYFTTTIVLAFSIFIMGTMGSQVWSTYFVVPYHAVRKYYHLVLNSLSTI